MRSLIAILALSCSPVFSYEITGKVIKITDGDTVHIIDKEQENHKIRLADIDAMELAVFDL